MINALFVCIFLFLFLFFLFMQPSCNDAREQRSIIGFYFSPLLFPFFVFFNIGQYEIFWKYCLYQPIFWPFFCNTKPETDTHIVIFLLLTDIDTYRPKWRKVLVLTNILNHDLHGWLVRIPYLTSIPDKMHLVIGLIIEV